MKVVKVEMKSFTSLELIRLKNDEKYDWYVQGLNLKVLVVQLHTKVEQFTD